MAATNRLLIVDDQQEITDLVEVFAQAAAKRHSFPLTMANFAAISSSITRSGAAAFGSLRGRMK